MDLLAEQRSNQQTKRKLEAHCEKQRQADRELLESLQLRNSQLLDEKCAKRDVKAKNHEAMCLRLGSRVAHLNFDMAQLQHEFEKAKATLERQRAKVENELQSERQKTERLRELKNRMAQNKRDALCRAQTSEKRLERAQAAEESLAVLQEEYDQLYEEMECGAECAQTMLAAEHFEMVLLRRTPPSAIGANIADAAQFLCPGTQVRVRDVAMIRKMRQEATLIGEAISAFRIATAKRVVSFGFDETTKMGDGLASINLQIETEEGEVCDEVLRAAILIPDGCAVQISRAIETKVFARARKLLTTNITHNMAAGVRMKTDMGEPLGQVAVDKV